MALTGTLRNTVKSILNKFGESVTIRQRTKTRDSQDDFEYTNTDTQVTAVVQIAGIQEELESRGLIRAGQATIYLRHTADISRGDLLKHQGIWYRIKSVSPVYVEGNLVYSECKAAPLEVYPEQSD